MGGIKVYLEDDTELQFRKRAMQKFGYAKGALSAGAEEAFQAWLQASSELEGVPLPEDPVSVLMGLLSDVEKKSVELQHEARKIRSKKRMKRAS